MIVGWDDNYPSGNFAHITVSGEEAPIPYHDGAWLVKNSWGSGERGFPDRLNWGILQGEDRGVYNVKERKWEYKPKENALHTGYFWLSYEDRSIDVLETYALEETIIRSV